MAEKLNYQKLVEFEEAAKKGLKTREEKLTSAQHSVQSLSESVNFEGNTATAIKNYLVEVHGRLITDLLSVKPLLEDVFAQYVAGYPIVDDNAVNFKLSQNDFETLSQELVNKKNELQALESLLSTADRQANSGGVTAKTSTSADDIFSKLTEMEGYISKQSGDWGSYEGEWSGKFQSAEDLISQIRKTISQYEGRKVPNMTTYVKGSFTTTSGENYAKALASIQATLNDPVFKENTKIAKKDIKAINAQYDAKKAAEEQKKRNEVDGAFKVIGGILGIAAATAAIVLSGGTATPLVIGIAAASGVFSAFDTVEGATQMASGDNEGFNPLRDGSKALFGNEAGDAVYDFADVGTGLLTGVGGASKAAELTEAGYKVVSDGKIITNLGCVSNGYNLVSTFPNPMDNGQSIGAGVQNVLYNTAYHYTQDATLSETIAHAPDMVSAGLSAHDSFGAAKTSIVYDYYKAGNENAQNIANYQAKLSQQRRSFSRITK